MLESFVPISNKVFSPGRRSHYEHSENIDYSSLYAEIDKAIAADLFQMELCLALGKLVSGRPEKGAAVMSAEYIFASYPDQAGFSPRNLRRMRDIFRLYEEYPEILEQAMKVGWTQNVVIMEADLDMEARYWYLLAVQHFGWSKTELTKQIAADAYMNVSIAEETQDDKNAGVPKKDSKRKNIAIKTVIQTLDFLKRLWYNKSWKVNSFRLTGIMGEAYG